MIDGKTFAAAIAAAIAARHNALEAQRERLAAEIRALEERLAVIARSCALDDTIESLRRELAGVEQNLAATSERLALLREVLQKESAALRERLTEKIEKAIRARETAVAAADVEGARTAFARELDQMGVSAQPSAAQLARAFHDVGDVADERRRRAHELALDISERLQQGVVAHSDDSRWELVRRRDELLSRLAHHGPLSGQLPPLAHGIAENDLRIVNAFRTFTLEPLLRDLSREAECGLIGRDPLTQLRRDLS